MRKIEHLLNELESNQLQTILAPSKRSDRREWDYIRVNCSESPKWYKEFCGLHPSSRGIRRGKFDTKIRRQHTLTPLRRLINKKRFGGVYEQRLLSFIRRIKL